MDAPGREPFDLEQLVDRRIGCETDDHGNSIVFIYTGEDRPRFFQGAAQAPLVAIGDFQMSAAVQDPEAPVFDQVPLAALGDVKVPDKLAPVVAVMVALPLAPTAPVTLKGVP